MKTHPFGYLLFLLFAISCSQTNSQSEATSESEETEQPEVAAFEGVDFDSTAYLAIIGDLTGIEKFYVQDDLYRLHGLLKYKEDERHSQLESDLTKKFEYPTFINVTLLDAKNGYIEFNRAQTECEMAMVYWNKSDGTKLIGSSETCCTMFCEGEVSFSQYDPNQDSYQSLNLNEVIIDYDSIQSLRPEGYEEGGFDYTYTLPQQGKNLRYCVGETCLELQWDDGLFRL
ncbi:MAG: hypothetical protein Tsb0034_27300 [Ekhidna sp.]